MKYQVFLIEENGGGNGWVIGEENSIEEAKKLIECERERLMPTDGKKLKRKECVFEIVDTTKEDWENIIYRENF